MSNFLYMLFSIAIITLAGCVCQDQQQPSEGPYYPAKESQSSFDDTAITTRVKTAFINEKLFGDKAVSPMSISVKTFNRVVYLTGYANNVKEIRNAMKIASSVPGVKRVESSIIIK